MRRQKRHLNSMKFFYVAGVVFLVLLITLIVLYKIYNKKLRDISDSMLAEEQLIGLNPNNNKDDDKNIETTSLDFSKTIEEVQKEIEDENSILETNEEELIESENISYDNNSQEEKEVVKKELAFTYPVEGEIIADFAMDKLQYSKTLEEWTVHQGIDIKADRTTVVKASEEGTITAIKNDPRYGLTIIIEHQDGFKTVYSNLLTTEFVTEDEKVEKGQSIGTVGNSAVFEIAEEPHLHFEIIKDGEYVDPKTYLK